ncbi:MAG: hypothetical protein AB1656_21090 [Candidatus Omnitrophota bacterium]
MKEKERPTLQEISLYYDGLLEGEAKRRVEESLADGGASQKALKLFQQFDCALEPKLSDAEIDSLLSDTVQQVRVRIHQAPRRREGGWYFLLNPRFLAAAVGSILLFAFIMTDWRGTEQAPSDQITYDPADSFGNIERPELTLVQQQAMLAVTNTAKSYLSKGLDYASEKSSVLKDSLAVLPKDMDAVVAVDLLRDAGSGKSDSDKPNGSSTPSKAKETLAWMGRQLVLGLSVSLMTLLSIL